MTFSARDLNCATAVGHFPRYMATVVKKHFPFFTMNEKTMLYLVSRGKGEKEAEGAKEKFHSLTLSLRATLLFHYYV